MPLDKMKTQAKYTLKIQVIICFVLSFTALIFSRQVAYSFWLGTAVTVAANWVFLMCSLRKSEKTSGQQTLMYFYQGEFLKWVTLAILCIGIFLWIPFHHLAFFTGFIFSQVLNLVLPGLLLKKESFKEAYKS